MKLPKFLSCLADLPLADVQYYSSTTSTNDIALAWAQSGAGDASMVVADEQISGRGRLNRTWWTPPTSALAFSLILKPAVMEPGNLALYSPLGAISVCEALESSCRLSPQIKWPNDVLLMERKTAGILAEAVWDGDHLQAVVLGIGVNVAPDSVPPSDQVMFPATCVETAAGLPIDRYVLLHSILGAILFWRTRVGLPDFFREWEKRLAYVGRNVTVVQTGQPTRHGKMIGVGSDGSLRLQNGNEEYQVLAGDVSLRPVTA